MSDSGPNDKNSGGSPPLDPSLAPTETMGTRGAPADERRSGLGSATGLGRMSGSNSSTGGRFLPGDMVAGRYRIIGLLGRGGMGEVYRADDLTLGQPVALKFLPQELERDSDRLERFLHEVRIARQVSHTNVCRVFDIGEVQGSHFLSMEFVDGEDLSTLLRRIGRLPEDKTVQIARQICAGLAAAHGRGIVHRDLKPANIMLDGDGQVRITDFGLAGLASSIKGLEIRSGTPDYMAPEQLAGEEVSTKSDLYALGLVLYELFTGKRAYQARSVAELRDMQRSATPTRPSEIVGGLDPKIEKVIAACLESDPRLRPASALAVSAALPGGDPMAAALAAGETPSPEMVAASGSRDGVRPWLAIGGWLAVVVGVLLTVWLSDYTLLAPQIDLPKSPTRLQAEARVLLDRLGYAEPPDDTLGGFDVSGDYIRWQSDPERVQDSPRNPATQWDDLNDVRPSPFTYWYRESPRPFAALGIGSADFFDPPMTLSGMHRLVLDAQGRLIELQSVPAEVDESAESSSPYDWSDLLSAAGLDATDFTTVEPNWNPLVSSDVRAAWTGTFADWPDREIRVEAAAYRGRPVFFKVIAPWTRPARMVDLKAPKGAKAVAVVLLILLFAVLAVAILLARRNLKLGRVDRRGAFRLATFIASTVMVLWIFSAHHTATFNEVNQLLIGAVSRALFFGGVVWVVYLALEPYVRKLWPELMISWTRLIAGRVSDPLVGRDLLLGSLVGVVLAVANCALQLMPKFLGRAAAFPAFLSLRPLEGFGGAISAFAGFVMNSVGLAVIFLLVVMVVRFFTTKTWIAIGVPALIMGGVQSLALAATNAELIPLVTLYWILLFVALAKLGLLGFMVAYFIAVSWVTFPLSTDPSVFYVASAWAYPIFVILLAGFGAYRSMAGQSMFRDPFAD